MTVAAAIAVVEVVGVLLMDRRMGLVPDPAPAPPPPPRGGRTQPLPTGVRRFRTTTAREKAAMTGVDEEEQDAAAAHKKAVITTVDG